MNDKDLDLDFAWNEAASATSFGYPVFKNSEDGVREILDVVVVSAYAQVPDGRWHVTQGQFYRCADEDEWLTEPLALLEASEEWAEFDRRTTFHSLDAAVKAAKARQQQVQAEYDAKESA
jgi:hypothetical protein